MKHKRKYRELEKSVRENISLANKGKSKFSHRLHLSESLKRDLDSVPSKPQDLSMQEHNAEEPGRKNNDVKPPKSQ